MRFDRLDKVGLPERGGIAAGDELVMIFPGATDRPLSDLKDGGKTMGHAAKAEPAMLHAAGGLACRKIPAAPKETYFGWTLAGAI
jgi:hypothetical protein